LRALKYPCKFLITPCTLRVATSIGVVFLCILFCPKIYSSEVSVIRKDAIFPNLTFRNTLSGTEQAYLKISRKKLISLNHISGNFFIVEIFNTYCTSCPRNIAALNSVYSENENDPQLNGKVRIIAIAAGNNLNEVTSYKKEYKVLYPILTDPAFTAHKALGQPRVPYTIFIKKNAKGNGIVVGTHQGVIESSDSLMQSIRDYFMK
jgi:hypothetical protein